MHIAPSTCTIDKMWRSLTVFFSFLNLSLAVKDLKEFRGARVVRLPESVWPTQYNISIKTDPTGLHFEGQVSIEAEVKEDTDSITLHASPRLALSEVSLFTLEGDRIPIKVHRDNITDLLIIHISNPLRQKEILTLQVVFSGELNDVKYRGKPNRAYYRVKTGDGDTEWMSGTIFQMVHAREVFPCWDEPLFKARFRLMLLHLPTHRALANMPLLKSESKNGWIVDHFDNSPLMSSFLVAFYLLQWNYTEIKTEDSVPLRVWASDQDLVFTNQSLEHARLSLAWLQSYTGVRDPMPKIDLIPVPKSSGGQENWGAISMSPEALVARHGSLFTSDLIIITHELAHTWFGNLVSPKWWDSLWLSEGAATFFSTLAMEDLDPGSKEQFVRQQFQEYYLMAMYNNDKALSNPMEYTKDLLNMKRVYYIYSIGSTLLRMLHYSLGPKDFQAGIQRYLSELQFGNAEPSMLYEALQYQWEGIPLSQLMDEWTNRGGIPIITATRSNGQLILTQENYFVGGGRHMKNDTKWWVPITFTTQAEHNFEDTKPKLWMRERAVLPDPAAPSEWVLLNIKAAGAYIVRYDSSNLRLIWKALALPNYGGIDRIVAYKLKIERMVYCQLSLEICDKKHKINGKPMVKSPHLH